MKKLAIAFALTFTTVVAACGDDKTTTPTPNPMPTGDGGTPATDSGTGGIVPNTVTVKSNEFVPKEIKIKVGEEVTFTWAGGNHNVVSGANCMADSKFTSGNPVSTMGPNFKRKFDTKGTFEYFCEPHCVSSMMKGTVVVE